jgi:hypothetical protein
MYPERMYPERMYPERMYPEEEGRVVVMLQEGRDSLAAKAMRIPIGQRQIPISQQ